MTGGDVLDGMIPSFIYSDLRLRFGKENAYDFCNQIIHINSDVWGKKDSSSLAIVAHECGHAIQPKHFHASLIISRCLVAILLYVAGGLSMWTGVIQYAYLKAFIVAVILCWMITLIIEFDAYIKAYRFLKQTKAVNLKVARLFLTRAYCTYLLWGWNF